MADTTLTDEEFWRYYRDFPLKFADGTFSTAPIPTVEELYLHFRERLLDEGFGPPADAGDAEVPPA